MTFTLYGLAETARHLAAAALAIAAASILLVHMLSGKFGNILLFRLNLYSAGLG
jgi:hypothetical protein